MSIQHISYIRALISTICVVCVFLFFQNAEASVRINKPTNYLGMVGYWTFDGPDLSASTAIDRSGQSNNGTLTGGPSRTIGKIGQALSFDGTDDYVDVGDISSNIQTISFWIQADTTTESIIDLNGTQSISVSGGTITATNFTSPTIYVDGSVSSTLDTNWHHVVITTGTSINVNNMDIGRIGGSYFDGNLDDIRLYNRVLSSAEISVAPRSASAVINLSKSTTIRTLALEPPEEDPALVLDTYGTDAIGAYSLQLLRTAYAGPVARIRRAGDNAQADFTASEIANGTMTAWVNAGGSDQGEIRVMYDQSGSGNDISNTTTNQPVTVEGGSLVTRDGVPVINFATTAAIGAEGFNRTALTVVRSAYLVFEKINNDNNGILRGGGSDDIFIAGSTLSFDGNASDEGIYAFDGNALSGSAENHSISLTLNTQQLLSMHNSAGSWVNITTFLSSRTSVDAWEGYVWSLIIYEQNQNTAGNDAGIRSLINEQYSIY